VICFCRVKYASLVRIVAERKPHGIAIYEEHREGRKWWRAPALGLTPAWAILALARAMQEAGWGGEASDNG